MSRNTIVALAVVGLAVLGLYALLGTPLLTGDGPIRAHCDDYLARPTAGWVTLHNCLLDMEQLVLESESGDFESLEHRRKGLSKKPYPQAPTWVRAWAPIRAEVHSGVVRVAWKIESADLLKWVNALERADDRERDRLWADPVLLRRMSRPAMLEGRAERAGGSFVLDTFGTSATSTLLLLSPGTPPKASILGPVLGAIGIVALAFLALRLLVRPPPETSPEAELTNLNVSDVKVELGELQRLRDEQRRDRR